MAEPTTSPRLLLSFTSLNGHNRRLQRLELVVPESWRLARHMSTDHIVIAGVHAAVCCCPDRDAPPEAAGVVKCPLCPRVILVQLSASSDLLDSHTEALPDGSRAERFSFAIRSMCIHQVIDAAWCDPDILPIVLSCTNDIRSSVTGCVNLVVRCLPGPRFLVVAIWESQQALSYGDEMYLRHKQADGQLHPATHPRLRLISDVTCHK
eukprot:m51a1_g4526 hypothetical protein (208) ;mRNA; f:13563-14580